MLIIILQFIVEYLVPRNYGIAMIFITPLTIFLSEAGTLFTKSPFLFAEGRLFNTIIGSLIGIIGGYVVYHENLENNLIFCKKYLKIINSINLDIIKNTLILIDRGIFLL